MTTIRMRSARCVLALCALLLPPAAPTAQTAPTPQVTAANAFLATLDEKQRQRVLYSFSDEQQRQRWSNFPVPMVPRGGLSLKEMTPTQRAATMALLSSMLSAPGYAKVQQIMEADEVNKVNEEKHPTGPRGAGGPRPPGTMGPPPGGPPPGAPGAFGPPRNGASLKPDDLFGKDLYFISILGKPSETTPWMLQFGGHHLALNITVAGARGVLTPTLTGAQPAIYTMNGQTVRPLAQESDQAIALLSTLDTQQRQQAILRYRVANLVLGPGQDGRTIQPEGLKASAMNEHQRALLLALISQWAGIIHESAATARMAEIRAGLDDTWFAWSGPTTVAPGSNITAYYRIQGPTVVIEYAPQGQGEEAVMHIHTMYRDPTNDYGRKLSAQ
jgi:hypothetical protein